jgi:hypothetical protein
MGEFYSGIDPAEKELPVAGDQLPPRQPATGNR